MSDLPLKGAGPRKGGVEMNARDLAEQFKSEIISWRRQLHACPEIAGEETATGDLVAGALAGLGIEVARAAGTGVVGVLRGEKAGKTVALRADMDALAITEATDLPYKSKNAGVMHACGHDGHMAMLLGAAKILAQLRGNLGGTVKFIFQPAEEIGVGALKLIEAGVMDGVDAVFGLHLWPDLPSGKISLVPGPRMASADKIQITVTGKSGHGSMPHQGIDAVVAAAAIVMNLQTIGSREVAPLEPAVVTVGKLAGGTSWNVTCDQVVLEGTTRCFSHEVRRNFPLMIDRIAASTAASLRARAETAYIPISPPVINDPLVTGIAAASLRELYGADAEGDIQKVMGGEDFAYLCENIPGALAFVGIGDRAKQTDYPLHNDKFNIDEDVLPVGAALHAQFALNFLRR